MEKISNCPKKKKYLDFFCLGALNIFIRLFGGDVGLTGFSVSNGRLLFQPRKVQNKHACRNRKLDTSEW